MIKTEIQKLYQNNSPYGRNRDDSGERWKLKTETIKKFDRDDKVISIKDNISMAGQLQTISGTSFSESETLFFYDNKGNVSEEVWSSSLKSTITKYENKYDGDGSLIGYDIIYKRYDNPMIRNNDSLEKETFSKCDIDMEYNDLELLKKSRKIYSGSNGSIFYEKIVKYVYDKSGEITKKHEKITSKSNDGEDYTHEENKHCYFYNDKNQKVEQVDSYFSKEKDGQLTYKGKLIKKKGETLDYNSNNELTQKHLVRYGDDGLINEEEISDSNDILYLRKYEYEFHSNK